MAQSKALYLLVLCLGWWLRLQQGMEGLGGSLAAARWAWSLHCPGCGHSPCTHKPGLFPLAAGVTGTNL